MPTTMTAPMRTMTKKTMNRLMLSIFRDRMSVYYAIGLGRADSAAYFYGELRNVAEQLVTQVKRQANERRAKERRPSHYVQKSPQGRLR